MGIVVLPLGRRTPTGRNPDTVAHGVVPLEGPESASPTFVIEGIEELIERLDSEAAG